MTVLKWAVRDPVVALKAPTMHKVPINNATIAVFFMTIPEDRSIFVLMS
jgi:hypothetical protein